jgi:predicted alpha/beta superfamily hydrolase
MPIADNTPRAELPGTHLHLLALRFYDVEHRILVYLPPGYEEQPDLRYPVLYVTDASWLFGAAWSALALYQLERQVEDLILVGVAEGQTFATMEAHRGHLFTSDPHPRIPEAGGADLLCRFFGEQLFPFIEQNYRASASDRGLVGFSLGGLWGSYVMATQPTLFRRYLVISPPVKYAGMRLFPALEQARARLDGAVVYAAISEFDYRDCLDSWGPWLDALSAIPGLALHHERYPGESHDSVAVPALHKGMRRLYGRPDFVPIENPWPPGDE